MNKNAKNPYGTMNFWPLWHNFFRRIIEMAENRRKQQKFMSLSLTSETAVEYTIWPANDTYIITVC